MFAPPSVTSSPPSSPQKSRSRCVTWAASVPEYLSEKSLAQQKSASSSQWLRDNSFIRIAKGTQAQFNCFESMLKCIEGTPIGPELLADITAEAVKNNLRLDIFLNKETFRAVPFDPSLMSNGVGTNVKLHCQLSPQPGKFDPAAPTPKQIAGRAATMFGALSQVCRILKGKVIRVDRRDFQTGSQALGSECASTSLPEWPPYLYAHAQRGGMGTFRKEKFSDNAMREALKLSRRSNVSHRNYVIYDDDTADVFGTRQSLLPLPPGFVQTP